MVDMHTTIDSATGKREGKTVAVDVFINIEIIKSFHWNLTLIQKLLENYWSQESGFSLSSEISMEP